MGDHKNIEKSIFSYLLDKISIFTKISIFDISLSICPPLLHKLGSQFGTEWVKLPTNGTNPRREVLKS